MISKMYCFKISEMSWQMLMGFKGVSNKFVPDLSIAAKEGKVCVVVLEVPQFRPDVDVRRPGGFRKLSF